MLVVVVVRESLAPQEEVWAEIGGEVLRSRLAVLELTAKGISPRPPQCLLLLEKMLPLSRLEEFSPKKIGK